jgi:hypothetical protein
MTVQPRLEEHYLPNPDEGDFTNLNFYTENLFSVTEASVDAQLWSISSFGHLNRPADTGTVADFVHLMSPIEAPIDTTERRTISPCI